MALQLQYMSVHQNTLPMTCKVLESCKNFTGLLAGFPLAETLRTPVAGCAGAVYSPRSKILCCSCGGHPLKAIAAALGR